MADYDDDFTADDTTDDTSDIKQFRAAKKQAAEQQKAAETARAEADAAKRELAFLRAGIDPESQTAQRIAKVHEGDWTADSLKATGVEMGWVTADAPSVPADEIAAHDRFAAANNGKVDGVTAEDDFLAAMGRIQSENDWRTAGQAKAQVLEQLKKAGIEIDNSEPSPMKNFNRGGVDKLGTARMFG
jgi:cytoskeletal protein RodZ